MGTAKPLKGFYFFLSNQNVYGGIEFEKVIAGVRLKTSTNSTGETIVSCMRFKKFFEGNKVGTAKPLSELSHYVTWANWKY